MTMRLKKNHCHNTKDGEEEGQKKHRSLMKVSCQTDPGSTYLRKIKHLYGLRHFYPGILSLVFGTYPN